MIPNINIEDYSYPLTEAMIAKYPLACRDESKLLTYKNGDIEEHIFKDLPNLLPTNSIMVFNNTKVVPARLNFVRSTGAHIEIFCLQPVLPNEYNLAFASTSFCQWACIVGNSKRWKDDVLTLYNPNNNPTINNMGLKARLIAKEDMSCIVEFNWDNNLPFSAVLEACGTIPIPPYLNRTTEALDIERYQTLYANIRGSVAAPTAGLHFTNTVLDNIKQKGIEEYNICLHVGAGTFLPVKTQNIAGHTMHREPFVVSIDFLTKLRDNKLNVIAVGTTSVRTLESLYYIGVHCIEEGTIQDVGQWEPYTREYNYTLVESLDAIIKYLKNNNLTELNVGTKIIIVPGFKFRVVDVLVTNFHQSESTLILLVSAFVGGDWRQIYNYAINHNFRFLSYGDSSLLFKRG